MNEVIFIKKAGIKKIIDTIFTFLVKKFSFGLGIAFFSILSTWFAVWHGYFFIVGKIDFQPGELHALNLQIFIPVGIVTILYLIQSGMLYPLGFPGLLKKYRIINHMLEKDPTGKMVSKLENHQLEELLAVLSAIPGCNARVLTACSYVAVFAAVILNAVTISSFDHSLIIFIGGSIVSILNGYFAYMISSYWISPPLKKIQETIFCRNIKFKKLHFASYKQHFFFALAFILLTMVVLAQYIMTENKTLLGVMLFIIQSIVSISFNISMLLNSLNVFLEELNDSTRHLAEGNKEHNYESNRVFLFPSYAYEELVSASMNYNHAAQEVNVIRLNLEKMIEERTFKLNRAKEEAETSNRVKSQFLANMSHEIRTPLSGIMGMIDLLLSMELNARQQEYLEIAQNSAYALIEIVNDILDFSKIEAGKFTLCTEIFNIRVPVKSAVDTFINSAAEKGIALNCHIGPGVPDLVMGDSSRLRQVIFNLIHNAIKFTEKGEVAITVKMESDDPDKVVLLFSVEDTGIGIPADKLDSIFESFSQVNGSLSRRFGGTGLGLAISKEIIETLGGAIKVESREGIGSRFYFTLTFKKPPKEEEPAAVSPPSTMTGETTGAAAEVTAKKIKILLAEDNKINRRVVMELAKKKGWEITAVANGREAVDRVIDNECRLKEF
ncbi:MAG TPA: ATP-binding protein, partial [Candidatus Deferrimicrobium sp.]|nr:ATP-binding protein [Candidatus Deferrimicrobium sp.]